MHNPAVSGCPILFAGPVPYLAAAAMWRLAVQVSAAVPVAAAARRAPAVAAEDVAAAAAAVVAAFVRPFFHELFECALFLGLC